MRCGQRRRAFSHGRKRAIGIRFSKQQQQRQTVLYCTAQCSVLRIEVTFVVRFFIVVSPINMHTVAAPSRSSSHNSRYESSSSSNMICHVPTANQLLHCPASSCLAAAPPPPLYIYTLQPLCYKGSRKRLKLETKSI